MHQNGRVGASLRELLPPGLDQHIFAQTKSRDGGMGPFFPQRCFVFFQMWFKVGLLFLPLTNGSGKQGFGR